MVNEMNPVTHGLVLTVVGMGLVFLALVIFLVSMVVLARLFPERETSARGATAGAEDQPSSGPSEAELAAIGAALAIWLKEPAGHSPDLQLGATLASSPYPWGIAASSAQRRS